jgi:D-alanyl-D-alanine carboxypeptidase
MISFKKMLVLILLLSIFSVTPLTVLANEDWPSGVSISADAAILMEVETGTILYEKNAHSKYYPASITKIMTALLTLENSALDEMVTYSNSAIFSIGSGSSNVGVSPDEILSVEDSLYALLLKSANEVANGLGEHVAGSMKDFAVMMTARAKEIGTINTNFTNASGLHDDNHYTSAYDMALIASEALSHPIFRQLNSTLRHSIEPTNRHAETRYLLMGNRMLNPAQPQYYAGCIGGKTGFTNEAGNTLVTYVTRDGMTLVAVILHSNQTHYADTKALFDFGFANFNKISIPTYDNDFVPNSRFTGNLFNTNSNNTLVTLNNGSSVVVPKDTAISELRSEIILNEASNAASFAHVVYSYADHTVGKSTLSLNANFSQNNSGDSILSDNSEESKNTSDTSANDDITSDISNSTPNNNTQSISNLDNDIYTNNSSSNFLSAIIISFIVICIIIGACVLINDTPKKRKERERKRNKRFRNSIKN